MSKTENEVVDFKVTRARALACKAKVLGHAKRVANTPLSLLRPQRVKKHSQLQQHINAQARFIRVEPEFKHSLGHAIRLDKLDKKVDTSFYALKREALAAIKDGNTQPVNTET